jgi:phosphoribosylanthranilate isomerase
VSDEGARAAARPRPRFKICCIASVDEARLAVACGASAVGLVSDMPSGPGVIDEDTIAAIVATVPPGVGSFLLTSLLEAEAIVAQQRRCRVNTIQLCDRPRPGTHRELRRALPGIALVQAVHVTGEGALAEAFEAAPHVDAILLDSGDPSRPVKELGGTGRAHDWSISRRIRAAVASPVFLAGGLRPQNVAEAIRTVEPFAVDVCSGVRTDGRLDEAKLRAFAAAVRGEGHA